MYWSFFWLFQFALLHVFADPPVQPIPDCESVASTEGLPSSLVEGKVCVISGQFVDRSVDVVIPGPEPLIFARSYGSLNNRERFGVGWMPNHQDSLFYSQGMDEQEHVNYVTFSQVNGSRLFYKHPFLDKNDKKKYQFELIRPKGLTNGSGNEISGRTNLNNYRLRVCPYNADVKITTGAGVVKQVRKEKPISSGVNYYQVSETKPNGIRFEYEGNNNGVLRQIKCLNSATNLLYSWVKLIPGKKSRTLTTSDNQTVKYCFLTHTIKLTSSIQGHTDTRDVEYVTDVEKPRFPSESYEYIKREDNDHLLLSKKRTGKKQFLGIHYYRRKHNLLGDGFAPIYVEKEDYRLNRVKQLNAPVGVDKTPIITHRFVYNIEEIKGKRGSKELGKGKTDVYDAYNHKTTYSFTKEHRLKHICKYKGTGNYQEHSKECFVWGKEETPQEGNLLCKYLKDEQGNIHHAKYFKYDERGNILEKELWGSLTGLPTPQITLDRHHLPINNGCEKEKKTCVYSQDGLNHLLTETDDYGFTTLYHYHPQSDLLAAKLLITNHIVQKREYYFYDHNHILIKKIIDDGKGLLDYDHTGLTQRFITYYFPRTNNLVHLPERIDQMYFDLKTKQEVLLNQTIYHYTAEGYLAKEDTYNSQGQYCYSKTWEYDKQGNCIKETNPIGDVIRRQYDEYNQLIFQQEPGVGYTLHNTYDHSNRLILQEEKHGDGQYFATRHRYNYLNQCVATIDPYGQETTYSFDDMGRQTAIQLPSIENESGAIVVPMIKSDYNVIDLPVCVTDAKGLQTKTDYNIRGQPLVVHYSDGSYEQFIYLLNGQLVQKRARNGISNHYKRDYQGRVLSESIYSAEGVLLSTEQWTYQAFHPASYTDKEGVVTHYHYDFAGRLVTQTKEGQRTDYGYDSLGREIEIKEWMDDTNYRKTIKVYDWLNRVVEDRLEDAQGHLYQCNQYTYDAKGNKILVKAGDQVTKTRYDAHQNIIEITNALGQTTYTTYNTQFINSYHQRVLQTTITDPLGYQTILTYDNANRLVSEKRKNPFGLDIAHQQSHYDLNGNLARWLDHVMLEGKITHSIETLFIYNENNQLLTQIEAAYTPEQKITHHLYNFYGQKITTTKPNGVILSHTYDAFGYLQSLTSSDHSIHYDYQYTLNGLVKQVIDQTTKTTTQRNYDSLGRMTEEKLGNGLTLAYQYDRLGRATLITLPDQTAIEYQFSAVDLKTVNRLTGKKCSYSHTDLEHNLKGLPLKSKLPGNNGLATYLYDPLDRCIQVESTFFKQTIPDKGYDAAGNLLSYETNGKSSSYTYDDFYQLQSETGHANHQYQTDSLSNRLLKDEQIHTHNSLNQLLTRGEETYTYDANGNLIFRQKGSEKTTYTYDALDRLTTVKTSKATTSYKYDSFNRRLSKKNVKEELYFHQGQEEIGAVVKNKITELKILGKGEKYPPIAIELNAKVYVPIRDLFGQISGLRTLQGELIETYRYSAFGEIQILNAKEKEIQTSQVNNPWRYANKRYDPETGFIAFGLRYYDPDLGRWLTADPSGFEDGPNLYAYVHHSPLIYFDQFGLFSFSFGLSSMNQTGLNIVTGFPHSGLEDSSLSAYLFNDPLTTPLTHKISEIGDRIPLDPRLKSFCRSEEDIPESFYYNQSTVYNLNDFINPQTNLPFNLPENPNSLILFVNGIGNTHYDHMSSLAHLGQIANHNVQGIFAPTLGFFNDIGCHFDSLIHMAAYEQTRLIHKTCSEFFTRCPEGNILICGHSRGCVNLRNTLPCFPPDQRDRISLIAVAPGGYIHNGMCKDVVHLVSQVDPIPRIDIKGFFRCSDTIVHLKPHPKHKDMDHSFNSPTYEFPVRNRIDKFLGR